MGKANLRAKIGVDPAGRMFTSLKLNNGRPGPCSFHDGDHNCLSGADNFLVIMVALDVAAN